MADAGKNDAILRNTQERITHICVISWAWGGMTDDLLLDGPSAAALEWLARPSMRAVPEVNLRASKVWDQSNKASA
ncbi:hypothetical protein CCP1ISM_2130004 [Azospirillaceae bacterium]